MLKKFTTAEIAQAGIILALLCTIAPFSILTTPVPFTLQMLILFTICFLLKFEMSTIVIVIYVFLGALGLPVFSGYRGGLGHLLGVTGGYIWSFMAMPFIFKLFDSISHNILKKSLQIFISFTFVCFVGIFWIIIFNKMPITFASFAKLFIPGYVIFLPFNMIISGLCANYIAQIVKKRF